MQRANNALRYAELNVETPATTDARSAPLCAGRSNAARCSDEKSDEGTPRSGAKSLARINGRMSARAKRTALRDALDLIRQEELIANMQQREARRRQRRWYVLGRAVDDLMVGDTRLHAQLVALLDRYLVRDEERRLFALPLLNTKP